MNIDPQLQAALQNQLAQLERIAFAVERQNGMLLALMTPEQRAAFQKEEVQEMVRRQTAKQAAKARGG